MQSALEIWGAKLADLTICGICGQILKQTNIWNIYNGQGHCVMRSVYMFGKAPIKFSQQAESIK
ncbi:hypothetical protein T02_1986 [Trichinella nativa]|uniref:Uncharacterized protein n=1 Tax=Trichinella nativa TaxID=6335 RepID=A0A0V1KSD9_9BILA|nr:hypothetical protein T02_1986 [Trichinella nativa]